MAECIGKCPSLKNTSFYLYVPVYDTFFPPLKILILIYVYVFTTHVSWCLQRPEEGTGSSGAGIIGACDLHYVGAGS